MILQSRRWRLLLRTITLVITSILMLAFAASASYALQDDTPLIVTTASQLFNKEQPINGRLCFYAGDPRPDACRKHQGPGYKVQMDRAPRL